MKKYFLFVFVLILLSACSNSTAVVDEKTVPKNQDGVIDKQAKENIPESKAVKNQGESKNNASEKTMTIPTINRDEFTDLAKDYSTALIKTNQGEIEVKFYVKESPETVNNFMNLAKAGFYNGTRFHRVISDFMIQAGDPLSKDEAMKNRWGTGGPGYKFDDEFNDHKLVRGSLAMANSGPNTNGSQFFIVTTASTPWLDGKHTNFGEVVSGMDVVDKIENVKKGAGDVPAEDMIIEEIELVK